MHFTFFAAAFEVTHNIVERFSEHASALGSSFKPDSIERII